MQTINIHAAKTNFLHLIALAEKGESFVIARTGKPVVKISPIEPVTTKPMQRLGFMQGQMRVPNDFDQMGGDEIEVLFSGRTQ